LLAGWHPGVFERVPQKDSSDPREFVFNALNRSCYCAHGRWGMCAKPLATALTRAAGLIDSGNGGVRRWLFAGMPGVDHIRAALRSTQAS